MLQPMVGAVFAAVMTIAMGLVSVELNEMQGLLDTREVAETRASSSQINQYVELAIKLMQILSQYKILPKISFDCEIINEG